MSSSQRPHGPPALLSLWGSARVRFQTEPVAVLSLHSTINAPALALLTKELSDVIDRIEIDWNDRGIVRSETAERLHKLVKFARRIAAAEI